MSLFQTKPYMLNRGEGQRLQSLGALVIVKATAEQTERARVAQVLNHLLLDRLVRSNRRQSTLREHTMTHQGIVKGDAQQRLGSVGFIIGAILFGTSGLLMPHATNPTSDLQEMLKPLGEYQYRTTIASLFGMVGFWMALIGVAGVSRSITARGAVWARLGFYFTLIGTALWTVCWALDMNTANAVANWLSTPTDSKAAAWSVVASLSAFGRGIVPTTWILYWLALAFLSIAMVHSDVYPRWLGWAGLIVSIPMITLGIFQIFIPRSITLTLIFSMLMLLTTLWTLATGLWVARKAW